MKSSEEIKKYIISYIIDTMECPAMCFSSPNAMEGTFWHLDNIISYINENGANSYRDYLGDQGFQASDFTSYLENREKWSTSEMFKEFSEFFKEYMKQSMNYNS
jgi:hypothetical protein